MEKIKQFIESEAFIPTKAHPDDAGWDLYSPIEVEVPALGSVMIKTGVHIALPSGTVGFIKNRSSMFKNGLDTDGTIDCGYTGNIGVVIFNRTLSPYQISRGDRIAQLVICELRQSSMELVESLEDTDRGNGGFGSTGK